MTGYESKRAMARDKLIELAQEGMDMHSPDAPEYIVCEALIEALAQPAQEPVAYGMWDTMIGYGGRMMSVRLDKGQDGCTVPLYTAPPQPPQDAVALRREYQSGYYDGKQAALAGREWNFCERCGKRTADLTTIHTCTPPPQEKNNG